MNFENLQMNNNGPPPTNGPRNESIENRGNTNGAITTEGAIAALEQHDQIFHRQVMHLRQQQVSKLE